MNVVFCGYRSWALEVIEHIKNHPRIQTVAIIGNKQEWDEKSEKLTGIDMFIFLGWSWLISDEFVKRNLCLGIHPSDLPEYRGGSPIQHQIMASIRHTKITLMSLAAGEIDTGDIWEKEDVDFSGDTMDEIFHNIAKSSIVLFNRFFNRYPDYIPQKQDKTKGSYYKRRKPEDSGLSQSQFASMDLEELYHFIRSLTSPYPNAYLYDSQENRLVFKEVAYIRNEEINK